MVRDKSAGAPATGEQPQPPPPEWPAHFPENCPDADTPDTDGLVFRIVRGNDARDWKCHIELGLEEEAPLCQRAALSCFRTLEDVREWQAAHSWLRQRRVARAELDARHGKIAETGGGGHHSLWLRTQYLALCLTLFVQVDPE